MVIGSYTSNLTENRRVAIPKRFREEIGEKFIVAKWYENCLVLVSAESWQELLNKLTGKSEIITASVRDTDRFIMGSAYELDADSQGRVVLPVPLVKYAGLTQEVLFIGLGDRIEIWDKGKWFKREEFISDHASELVERLAKDANAKK
jgi:MraZ protein